MKKSGFITAVLLVSLILAPSIGTASSISITANNVTGDIGFSWDGFTYSFTVNGVTQDPPASGSVTDSATGNINTITFGGFFESVNGSNWVNNGDATIGFLRADGTLSNYLQIGFSYRNDILSDSNNPTNMTSGLFVSAINGAVLDVSSIGGPPLVLLPAVGTDVEVSGYFIRDGDIYRPITLPLGFDSFNVSFDSGASPVPEPSTMMLLGSGLAGLVGYGRRRFKI